MCFRHGIVVMQRAIEAIDFELAANIAPRDLVDAGEFVLAAELALQLVERDAARVAHAATTPCSLSRAMSASE